jgi:methoxymalonate biosynthesis acyl carrier protein
MNADGRRAFRVQPSPVTFERDTTVNAPTIEIRLVEFLRSVAGLPALDGGTELLDAGIVDSLTMMDLLVFIESEFGLRLDFSDLRTDNFRTPATLAALIAGQLNRPRQAEAA